MKNRSIRTMTRLIMALAIGVSSIAVFAGTAPHVPNNAEPAARHPKTVRISVSKDGFSPAQIRAEKGYELTLIFTQTDKKGCSKDVVFSSLNIRKKLLLNKEVTIVITPQEYGVIAFACSSGSLKGSITIR